MDWERLLELGLLGASIAISVMGHSTRSPTGIVPVPPREQPSQPQPPPPPPTPPSPPSPPEKPVVEPAGDAVEVPLYYDVIRVRVVAPIPWDRLPRDVYEIRRGIGILPIPDAYSVDTIVGRADGRKREPKVVRDSMTVVEGIVRDYKGRQMYLNYGLYLCRYWFERSDSKVIGHREVHWLVRKSWRFVPRKLFGGAQLVRHEWNWGLRGGYRPVISWIGRFGGALAVKFDLSNLGVVAALNKFDYFDVVHNGRRVLRKPAPEIPPVITLPAPRGRHTVEVLGGKAAETGLVWIEVAEVEVP